MTSISSLSNTNYQSPLQLLQNELQSQVGAGTVSSSDQSALSSALTNIDSDLKSGSSQSSGTQSSPGDVKSKINDLIQNEVTSGNLTSAQATELQGVFKAAFSNGPGGAGGPGGPGGAGGPPPGGPPPGGGGGPQGGGGSASTSSTDSDAASLLQQFLQSLQSSQSSSSTYGSNGSNSTSNDSSSSLSALLVD